MVPSDHPTSPSELARLLPAPLKLLRTLKFCEDASDEPRTQVGWLRCTAGMAIMAMHGGCGGHGGACRSRPCHPAFSPPLAQEAHQLCDLAMVQLRLISGRLLKGKEQAPELGRFPGQVVLPRLCFRPTNLQQQGETQGSRGWK